MNRVVARVVRCVICAGVVCCAAAPAWAMQERPLTTHEVAGSVSDTTGALPGAEVRLVDRDRVVWTDATGTFCFTGVPAGPLVLNVHLPGFLPLRRSLRVPLDAPLDLRLEPDLRFAEAVVVSAAPWALTPLETAQQTDQVAAATVRRERVASVGEALAKVPGVAFIPTGNALGTPVIRGISEHRIRVLNDGIALNHQQFSWRHSPNVEPGFAERIELIRGPSSVLYGPDAMGGVINLIHGPLPSAPDGGSLFHGELSTGLSTNTGELAGQARLEGALGRFGWRADAVRRAGDDVTTPRGALDNTDFSQINATGMAGYHATWGSARARWHHWQAGSGFYRPAGFRLDLRDDLVAGDLHVATRAGVVEVLAGRQHNSRQAFDAPDLPATLDVDQDTITVRGALLHRRVGSLRGQAAIEFQHVTNDAIVGTLVPDYETSTTAVMLFEEVRLRPSASMAYHRVIVSAGGRADIQRLDVCRPGATVATDYRALTGALGVVIRLHESVALAGNLGRGWRPPSAFELHAHGVHGGVAGIQWGNAMLHEESNVNAELSARYQGRVIQASVSAYRNAFDDYIYLADAGIVDSALPVFLYRQADATLHGIEATLDVSPRPWMTLGLAGTLLDTRNVQTGRLLPQTPPDRLLATAQWRRRTLGPLRQALLAVDAMFVGAGEVSGPDEPLGTPTRAYQVVDLRTSATLPTGSRRLEVTLLVRNVFDREYRDFLWSYKPFAPNPGRDVRLTVTWAF